MNTVKACDISHWQVSLNVATMWGAGIELCVVKATQNSGWVDKQFHTFAGQLIDAGKPWGAYHFFDPNYDPVAQADHFVRQVKRHDLSLLRYAVIDVERSISGNSTTWHAHRLKLCFRRVAELLPLKVDVLELAGYSSKSKLMPYGTQSWYNNYQWWIAYYPWSPPAAGTWLPANRVPAGVDPGNVFMWQWTDKGTGWRHGVGSNHVDVNYLQSQELPPPPTFPYEVIINTPSLRIRNRPTTAGSLTIGQAFGGHRWTVLEHDEAGLWGRVVSKPGSGWLYLPLTRNI